jgi:hypothetical protein
MKRQLDLTFDAKDSKKVKVNDPPTGNCTDKPNLRSWRHVVSLAP